MLHTFLTGFFSNLSQQKSPTAGNDRHTVGEKKDSTKRYLWSKTILATSSVGGPGVDPPPRKIKTFFLMSLALSVPFYRHFQSNGANWRSSKHLTKKFI